MTGNSPGVGDDVCPIPPGNGPVPDRGPADPFLAFPERWRSALEGYVPRITPSNQRPLGHERAMSWAVYLKGMHQRIHPLFANSFMESLDRLPPSDPMNDQHLTTRLEVVLSRDGHVQKMGIVRPSGRTKFDVAALDSVDCAQPFGPVPDAIVSSDGFAYLQWEFRRDEAFACSTLGARPFVLADPPP